jgi:hypothetical protein
MTTPLSQHAHRALESLQQSWAVNKFIHSDAVRNDAHCPSPGNPNERFNGLREYYLGSLQVCHAADALNSYCQSILAEIIKTDAQAWADFDATIDPGKRIKREAMIANLLSHRERDGAIRAHLRDVIQCYWPFESDVITCLRNKFVHQNGHDPKRSVEALIASKKRPWCVICVDAKQGADEVRYFDAEWLDADVKLGEWACAHFRTHIHSMDQNLCYRFKLPRDRSLSRPISRQLGSLPTPRRPMNPQFGGLSVNLASTTADMPSNQQPTGTTAEKKAEPKVRRLIARKTKEETDCELAWHDLKDAIFQFIKEYTKKIGVAIRSQHGGGIGNWAHSVRGLELCLDYEMGPEVADHFSTSDFIGIRLRERDLVPYVTIWSRRSQMRDFVTPKINPEIQNYLMDVIDKVITQTH